MKKLRPVAHIYNDFSSKFGIPKQSNLVQEMISRIVFHPAYRSMEAVRGLEDFCYIWLIWGFSETERADWSPTVRPPALGGNTRMGVFATRSPYRPNGMGLSSVRLLSVSAECDGPILYVAGADLMNSTPIYDIKPYLPFTDSHPEAAAGFAGAHEARKLHVVFANESASVLPQKTTEVLKEVLANDPRPSYHNDPTRVYGMIYGGTDDISLISGKEGTVKGMNKVKRDTACRREESGIAHPLLNRLLKKRYEVKFSVNEEVLTVHDISPLNA